MVNVKARRLNQVFDLELPRIFHRGNSEHLHLPVGHHSIFEYFQLMMSYVCYPMLGDLHSIGYLQKRTAFASCKHLQRRFSELLSYKRFRILCNDARLYSPMKNADMMIVHRFLSNLMNFLASYLLGEESDLILHCVAYSKHRKHTPLPFSVCGISSDISRLHLMHLIFVDLDLSSLGS